MRVAVRLLKDFDLGTVSHDGTTAVLECGHTLTDSGLQSDMRVQCQECPQEEYDG